MRVRLKTFGEFVKGITIAHKEDGGVKILCQRKGFLMLETNFKPWNTKDTRKSFLVKYYIEEILWKCNPSKKISRIEGFELLGKRCMYCDTLGVIMDAWDVVDKETGETDTKLIIVTRLRTAPFETLKSNVQL